MIVKILRQAEDDLVSGYEFYDRQAKGLGSYFLDSLYSDIDSLKLFGGVHRKAYKDYHRLLSKRFPFAIFYTLNNDTVFVRAVVDCRNDPRRIQGKL